MNVTQRNPQLHFTAGWVSITLSRDFYHNCLTKDPFPHCHPMFELHYLIQGDCSVEIERETIQCKQGDFVLLPPRCTHRLLSFSQQAQTISLMFSLNESSNNFRWFLTLPLRRFPDTFAGEARLLRIREELIRCQPMYVEKIQGELIALLADIVRVLGKHTETSANSCENRVENIESYLLEHRFDNNCSCEGLAKHLHLSRRQVHRLCQQYYGSSFRQLLTSMRMETAAYRLQTTNISVGELALELGYASVASFSAAYRRYFGHSPSHGRVLEDGT